MTRRAGCAVLAPAVLVAAVTGGVLGRQWAADTFENVVLDNRSHHQPCDRWPSAERVRQVLSEQDALVRRVVAVDPGTVFLSEDTASCPGRSDVTIHYGSHADRVAIERLVAGTPLAGLPLNWRNV